MQDDPPEDDRLKAKWEKIYQDICDDLEEPTQQDDCLEIGWQRDAYYSDQKLKVTQTAWQVTLLESY